VRDHVIHRLGIPGQIDVGWSNCSDKHDLLTSRHSRAPCGEAMAVGSAYH
jgi:hypothetical protein